MALYHGLRVARLTIVPDPTTRLNGHTSFAPGECAPAEVLAMVAMAGPLAELLQTGGVDQAGSRGDWNQVAINCARAGADPMLVLRHVLSILTTAAVPLCPAVHRLADLLLDRAELDAEAILEAYNRQPTGSEEPNVIFWRGW